VAFKQVIRNIKELATPLGPEQSFTADRGIETLSRCQFQPSPLKGKAMGNVLRLQNAAVATHDNRIVFAGSEEAFRQFALRENFKADQEIDARQGLVTPGLIDPHTHLIFDGNRANEFLMRCQGKTYQEIAQAGGGIVASTSATRGASQERLVSLGATRLNRLLAAGTTTCEIKTGYGLDLDSELTMLKAIFELRNTHSIGIVPTFMPAHAVPKELTREVYVASVIEAMLPEARALVTGCNEEGKRLGKRPCPTFVDVFCDQGYFTLDDTKEIFEAARQLDFQLKVHADEFVNLGATTLAVKMKAASADHLLNVSDEEISLLANSNTIAVLLPGTSFYLNLREHARARAMLEKNAAIALGSDFNPGSCHIFSLPFIWGLACMHLKLSVEEALTALTINAAWAIGLGGNQLINQESLPVGIISPNYAADLCIYAVKSLEEVPYNIGFNPVAHVMKGGKFISGSELLHHQ
jgi:imidazolonepropionase